MYWIENGQLTYIEDKEPEAGDFCETYLFRGQRSLEDNLFDSEDENEYNENL